MFSKSSIRGISLDAAGLIALADLKTISQRTALTGTSSFMDILLVAPGIHCQQAASEVNSGEYPQTGAMTTGYVFRIENQATVSYLQNIGQSGHLVNAAVKKRPRRSWWFPSKLRTGGCLAAVLYLVAVSLTPIVLVLLGVIHDFWALGVLSMLIVARLINVVVIKRRTILGWKGAEEGDVRGDLLVILSQDRWVRLRGLVNDLKVVTAGQWLRDENLASGEGFATAFATLLVYTSAALASNASTIGSLLIACLLLISVALLGLCNLATENLQMFDRIVYKEGKSKPYNRRLDMVVELVTATKRDDWATGMGLIPPKTPSAQKVRA